MSGYWEDFPGMSEALERVLDIIRDSVRSDNPIVSIGLSGLFDQGGKLLRPGLLLIAAGFGEIRDKHYSLAACLEMLHTATLVHDDVIDESPIRRGEPSIYARYGNRNAVMVGDHLLSRCFLLAAKHCSMENALALARVMAVICGMEIEQNSDRYKSNLSLRRYLRKIMGKSAILFALSCHIGAAEAELSPALTARLRRTGYNIGMAFQIIDDILDYTGEAAVVRKPLGKDLMDGLVTLPLICSLSKDRSGKIRDFLSGDSFTKDPAPGPAPAEIIHLVRESGGIEEAQSYAEKYTRRALREIAGLPRCPSRDMLDTLTRRLLLREG
jgi:heptaprenyl diphosphate synthase